MLRRLFQQPRWRRVIAALIICGPLVSNGQILPQFVAGIASLDHDHDIFLVANGDGVDLILSHHDHSSSGSSGGQFEFSEDQAAHIIHFAAGDAAAKQCTSLIVSAARQVLPYHTTALVEEWGAFVAAMPLAYSRPPPGRVSTLAIHCSTLLLI